VGEKMKPRNLFMPLLAFALFNTASAQEGLHLAILAQVQSKTIGGDFYVGNFQGNNSALKKELAMGYQAGIAFGYGFSDNIGVNLGAYYSVQGQDYADFTETINDLTHNFKRSVSLNYLKIPIHATYISDPTAAVAFSAFGGFYYAVLLSYTDKYTLQYATPQEMLFDGSATVTGDNYKWEYTNHGDHYLEAYNMKGRPYEDNDYGISAGAGIVLRISDMVYLPVMATYQLGLADIKNHSASETRYSETVTYWDEHSEKNMSEKYSTSSIGLMVGLKLLIDELPGY
jgi:hypothetical protein